MRLGRLYCRVFRGAGLLTIGLEAGRAAEEAYAAWRAKVDTTTTLSLDELVESFHRVPASYYVHVGVYPRHWAPPWRRRTYDTIQEFGLGPLLVWG